MALIVPGTSRPGRPKKTGYQQIKDDMVSVGVTQDVVLDRKDRGKKDKADPRILGRGHQSERCRQVDWASWTIALTQYILTNRFTSRIATTNLA